MAPNTELYDDIIKESKESKESKEKSILQIAHNLVHSNRGEDYGHPLDDFSKTAAFWSIYKGVRFSPEDVALMMVFVKVSREMNKHKEDNLVDIAGYIETLSMVIEEKKYRNEILSTTFAAIEDVLPT